MFEAGSLLIALFLAFQYQVTGQITAPAGTVFRPVQIESIDHKIVKYDNVNKKGNFSFKVPEGQYKITITTENGLVDTRTIEVRDSFANENFEIPIKISLLDTLKSPEPANKAETLPADVSSKAADEFQHAIDAKGNAKKAREHLERALAISPKYPAALDALGKIDVQQKQFGTAAERFQKAIDLNPNFYPAHVDLGGVLLAMGDYDRALVENSKAVEMQPGDSVAQSQLGQVLFRLNKYGDALQHLEIAKQLDPMSYTLPGLYIAQIHQARGENAEAVAAYKDFLKDHPGHELTGSIQNEIIFLEKQGGK
ncbi:MAG TPA: tetratricopeptide repeat protein [Terriglobia bacterium]|jgi:tetratricopeptide (TPR) repeat protein